MSVLSFLFDFFDDEEARTEYANDPDGYLDEHLPEGMTSAEFYEGLEGVCGQLPPEQASIIRGVYNLDGPSTPPPPNYPPPPPQEPGESDVEYAVRQINYYSDVVNVTNQTYEDNDTTTINDQDTNIDNSVNQNITAFGDVTQDFDNDVVTGDDAVAAGDDAQVNTGDGAVQVGGDLYDSTVATGDVEGSVTGDVYDSVVGDNNQVIDIDGGYGVPTMERLVEQPNYGSQVGPVAFGDGDAIQAENVNQGDGVIVDDVRGEADIAVNTGGGDQAVVQGSDVSESSVGGGDVTSNDVDINAYDDSAVAFGEGSSAEVDDVDIQDNSGTVQVAGDDSNQQGITDNDVNTAVDVDVDLGGGLTRSPVPVLAEVEAEPAYDGYDDAPDDSAPAIDDSDTFNQNMDTDDLDGLDA